MHDIIRAIPFEDTGTILPSVSPYSTYKKIRALCSAATIRLDLFDPYIDRETFHRYVPDFPAGVRVRIVTSNTLMDLPPLPATPNRNQRKAVQRRDRIVAVSELLAAEFPDHYEFYVSSEQHDRHIRVDDEILHLGGSSKDAGKDDYFTISRMDPTQSTHAFLDDIISRSDEWFGPNVRTHRNA